MSKPDTTAMAFIKKARLTMELSQEKFGEMLDCTKSNVSGWEHGRHIPPYKVLRMISRISGVPLPSGLTQEEDIDAKVYKTADTQKQRIIEMVFQIGEQDVCDFIENSLRMALGLELIHKHDRRMTEDRRKEVRTINKNEERRTSKDRRSPPSKPFGGGGGYQSSLKTPTKHD